MKSFRVSRNGEFVGYFSAESKEEARKAANRYAEEYGAGEPPSFEVEEKEAKG